MSQKTQWSQFGVLISVFFFWGFVAAGNDILIPVFKDRLQLTPFESQLISFAFYVAYTVGSLIYYFLSRAVGEDILNRIGYKNGIALGLAISALGTLLFYPAAETASYPLLLGGLFVVGLGFSIQQTAANPLAIVMGDPRTGSQRLSMAGGINNFGSTIGPSIVSFAIFGTLVGGEAVKTASIESVKIPYLILGALFLLVGIIFKFSPLPNKIVIPEDEVSVSSPTDVSNTAGKPVTRNGALGFSQLWLGMIGIFVYVGVEVATASNLPLFLEEELQISTQNNAPYISLYWASLMMGRWTSSIGAFNLRGGVKQILNFLMPYLAFGVFIIVNKIANHDLTPFYLYAFVILSIILADYLSKGNPARQLLIQSVMGIIALLIGIFSGGMTSVYAFISVGLFCSTLWPCIFTLAIAGLGKHTNQGASFLIMMIMGGGIISLLQGRLAENDLLGIKWSYLVGVLCFAYLAFYAVRAKAILKNQGIDFDSLESSGAH